MVPGPNLSRFEPAVKRATLIRTAGVTWILVGIFLVSRGSGLFYPWQWSSSWILGTAFLLGLLKSRMVFNRIIDKNIQRIRKLVPEKEKICIFAFQALQSYLLVALMMILGLVIRSMPIDTRIIGGILTLIGTALIRSGLSYLDKVREIQPIASDLENGI